MYYVLVRGTRYEVPRTCMRYYYVVALLVYTITYERGTPNNVQISKHQRTHSLAVYLPSTTLCTQYLVHSTVYMYLARPRRELVR